MCGICGVVQLGGPSRPVVDQHVLERMTDQLRHRGPDDCGYYAAPGVALGVRRLSIVDVEGGHQPFPNEDETIWAIQNGELYNHVSVHGELEAAGHRFSSRCDTEVLPHLYEHAGDDLPARLRGKFALAVWDGRRRRAVIARDRLGVKPLYYAVVGDLLLFASELKSLFASGLVDARLDYEAIDAYLTLGFFPGPATPLAQVKKLRPGHRLVVEGGGFCEESYWTFPRPAPDRTLDLEHATELLLTELEDAVRARLMSDVPLGAMLSGGLDSSLIVALMARNMSEPVKTFSVGFVEAGEDNELADARLVADAFGCDHYELELSMTESSVGIDDLVWALDEPVADLSALGFMALSELASRHVTVALAGQGADELFGGYSRHRRAAIVGHARTLPRPLVSGVATVFRRRGGRYARFADALQARDPGARQLVLRTPYLDDRLRTELVREPLRPTAERASAAIASHAASLDDRPLEAVLFLDAQLGLVDDMLHYFDRVSMAHSLEVRVPFLDHRVVELAARIPSRLKVRRNTTKFLLRQAAKGLLPDSVLEKRKVGFFNRTVSSWLEAQLKGEAGDYLLEREPAFADFLDPEGVRRLVTRFRGGTPGVSGDAVYAILVLEVWLTTFLPRALAAGRAGTAAA
jgi:asparagine synthase (glutamine-hydrolysing)